MFDRLPENGAGGCGLPDTGASEPALLSVSPLKDEIYAGTEAVCEVGSDVLFPNYLRLAKWLIKAGRAKAVTAIYCCDNCEEDALYEYEGHRVCGEWCLADVLDEYGLAERVVVEEVERHGG